MRRTVILSLTLVLAASVSEASLAVDPSMDEAPRRRDVRKPPAPRPERNKTIRDPLRCRIVSVAPQGGNTIILINRGRVHGVQAGQTGKVPGAGSFKVSKVFTHRSRAKLAGPVTQLVRKKTCILHRP